ncbi:MAG: hypothetical protein ACFFBD_09425 [Candidatus Hodarchaeota archaeon]
MKTKKILLLILGIMLLGAIQPLITVDAWNPFPTYTGYVKSKGGVPIANADVYLYSNGHQVSSGKTASNGYYCVGSDYVNFGYIKVVKEGHITQTKSVSSSGGTYNFYLNTRWALIVAGLEPRHVTDALGMYDTLTNFYGFTEDTIYLITWPLYRGSRRIPRDGQLSHTNIGWACGQIANRAGYGDQVVIWILSHGETDSFESGQAESTSAEDFDGWLDGITCSKIYIFLGCCHSGGFIEFLNDTQNRAIYTACRSNELANAETVHSSWAWATYRALNSGTGPHSNAEEADVNNDNRVSLNELFNWAYDYITVTKGYTDQHPKRWLGSSIGSDTDEYIGDMYYK